MQTNRSPMRFIVIVRVLLYLLQGNETNKHRPQVPSLFINPDFQRRAEKDRLSSNQDQRRKENKKKTVKTTLDNPQLVRNSSSCKSKCELLLLERLHVI